jgi:hypothetical protein
VALDGGGQLPDAPLLALDVDGDGLDDLFARVNETLTDFVGWQGAPAGLGAPVWALSGGRTAFVLGDIDGDGSDELASGTQWWGGSASGPVLRGERPGRLVEGLSRISALGDLDGDGFDDFALPEHDPAGAYFDSLDGPVKLMMGSAAGPVERWTYDRTDGTGAWVLAAELDGDPEPELVLMDLAREDEAGRGELVVLDDILDPAGPTPLTVTPFEVDLGGGLALASLGDTDSDGLDELLFADSGRLHEIPWDPAAGFDLSGGAREWGDRPHVGSVLTRDLDSDGVLDLVASV